MASTHERSTLTGHWAQLYRAVTQAQLYAPVCNDLQDLIRSISGDPITKKYKPAYLIKEMNKMNSMGQIAYYNSLTVEEQEYQMHLYRSQLAH